MLRSLFLFAAVFVVHPLFGLCAVAGTSGMWVAGRWYLRRARTAYLAEGAAASEVSETLAATAEGARTIEAFDLADRRVRDGDDRVRAAFAARVRTLFLRCVLFPASDISHTLAVALMILVGGICYLNDLVSLGAVIAASLYVMQVIDPLTSILMWMEELQRSGASMARIKGVGLAGTEPTGGAEPRDDRLEVTGVRYAYTVPRRAPRRRPGRAAGGAARDRRPVRRRQVHPRAAAGRRRRPPHR